MQAAKALRNEKEKKRRVRNRLKTKQGFKSRAVKQLQNFAPYLVIMIALAGIFLASQYGSQITGFVTGANETNNAPQWQGRTIFTLETSQTRIINLEEYSYDEDYDVLEYKITKDSGIDAKLQNNSIIIDGEKSTPGEHEINIRVSDGKILIDQKVSVIVLQSIEEVKKKKAETEIETELLTKDEVKTIIVLKQNSTSKDLASIRENVKSQLTKKGIMGAYDASEIEELNSTSVIIAKITKQGLAKLEQNGLVESIFIDRKLTTGLFESVPLINATNLTSSGINLTGKGQTACVIDTGIDNSHDAFAGRVIDEKCFCSVTDYGAGGCCANNASTQDIAEDDSITSHGTHVAGIIASNGTIKGVAPEANLIVVKACDNTGQCAASDVMKAIDYCNEKTSTHNIRVISGSFGDGGEYNSSNCPTYIDNVLNTSNALGISTTFSAGNEYFTKGINYPACSPFTIAVGASTKQDNITDFSNRGETLDVLAPGAQIQSTIKSGYGTKSGTSMSTAHVAGGILLIKERDMIENKSHSSEIIRDALKLGGVNISSWSRIDIGRTISIIDYVVIENVTFNGTNETISEETFHVAGGAAPTVILNSPANLSITARYYQELNITASDPESDVMNVSIYGDNISSTPTELIAFYQNVNNITQMYNWTAPTIGSYYQNDAYLIGYWRLDKNGTDTGPRNLNGSLINGATINLTNGYFGGGSFHDGINDIIRANDTGNTLDFDNGANITLTAWIYPKSFNVVDSTVIAKGRTDGTDNKPNYHIYLSNTAGATTSKIRFSYRNVSNTAFHEWTTTNAVIEKDKWQFVAVTYNYGTGSSVKVYHNGTSVAGSWTLNNGNAAPILTNEPLFIGGYDRSGGLAIDGPFNGSIDEVAIFNRSLSASEIKDLYRLKNGVYYWNANANDSTSVTTSATNQFTIQSRAPYVPTLNAPANASISTLTYREFNVTVSDPDGDLMNVSIYADNLSATPTELIAFYENVTNNSILIYNWTAPTAWMLYRNDPDLMVYYKLDFNATDLSSNANHGTVQSGASINSTTGYIGGGGLFDGVNDFINSTSNFAISGTVSRTITAWVKVMDNTDTDSILSWGSTGVGQDFRPLIRPASDTVQLACQSCNRIWNFANNPGEWHHIAIVLNSSTGSYATSLKAYGDGVELTINSTTNATINTPAGKLFVGTRNDKAAGTWFNGTIDEVAIWNRSLSVTEIASLYTLGNGTYYWNVNVSDINGNSTLSSTNNFIVGADIIKPSITDVRPLLSATNATETAIEIAANATDDFALDSVWTNITLPNASIHSLTLISTGVGNRFNGTYTIPALAGLYNITFYANDTTNNLNNSITTNFTATSAGDAVAPSVTVRASIYPGTQTTITNGQIIILNATVTDDVAVDTVKVDASSLGCSSTLRMTQQAATTEYNASCTLSGATTGTKSLTVTANDTSNNINNLISLTVIVDATPPSISFVSPTLSNGGNSSSANIISNISIVESALSSVIYNWNGTNYTLFNDSLFLVYNFNNVSDLGESDTKIVDIKTGKYNATFQGNAKINTTGKYEAALQLDGTSDYAQTTNSTGIEGIKQLTIQAWVKSNFAPADAGYYTIVSRFGLNTQTRYFQMRYRDVGPTNSRMNPSVIDSENTSIDDEEVYTGAYLMDGNWHHTTMTINFNTGEMYTYIDGEITTNLTTLNTTRTLNPSISTQSVYIGGGISGPKDWNGTIDEVTIWNRTLTNTEIQQQYFTNLKKYNNTQYYLYVNQTLNSTTGLTDGTYTHQAFALDSITNSNSTEQRSVTVDATAPTITLNSPANSSIDTDGSITFNATVSDSGSGLKNVTLIINGILNQTNATGISGADYMFIKTLNHGANNWSINAYDNVENLRQSATRTIIVNNIPSLSLFELYPASPIQTNNLQLNATCSDPDSDTVTVNWNVFKDGVNQTALANSQTVANGTLTTILTIGSGNLTLNEVWYASGSCSDSFETTSRVNTTSRTISDGVPPSISFVSPTLANDSKTSNSSYEINVSIVESALSSVIYNWNGTNYTLFNDSLQTWLDFDDSDGNDSTTHDLDIVSLSNGAVYNTTHGKYSGSLHFNGTVNNRATLNSSTNAFDGTKELTVMFWAKANDNKNDASYQVLVGKFGSDTATDRSWNIQHRDAEGTGNDRIALTLVDDNGVISANDEIIYNGIFNDFNWHQIAVTISYTQGNASIYFDGTYQGKFTGLNTSSKIQNGSTLRPVTIGCLEVSCSQFNGSIDQLKIWNTSLTSTEIQQQYFTNLKKYNNTQYYLYINQTLNSSIALQEGTYTYQTYATDTTGNLNTTGERTIIKDTTKPSVSDPRPILSSSYSTGTAIEIAANATDNIDLDVVWANITMPNASTTVLTLATATGNKFNGTYTIPTLTGLYNITFYANDTSNNINGSITSNFSGTSSNNFPTKPTLTDPTNGNATATNRTPILRWSASTDADSDPIMYNITLECTGTCSPYAQYIRANTTLLNFTINQSLQVDTVYKWNVTADDFVGGSNVSTTFNFTVASLISATLTNSRVDFGALAINVSSDTTSNNPLPLRIRNDGNVYIDVNLTGDQSPWSTVALNNVNFQTKAGGGGTINSSTSLTAFTNIAATTLRVIGQLNFSPDSIGNTSAEIELNITVPEAEPAGQKEANLTITVAQTS